MKPAYHPSRFETGLSLLVLGALIGIAGAIYHSQSDFNPAVEVGRMAAVAVLPQTADGAPETGRGWSGLLPDMAVMTPPEVFRADNLYDKIDGKEDLYLSSGFRELRCQRFKIAGAEENWLEIFVYDMGSLRNAFSVFSRQRREEAAAAGIGRFSYQTKNALFFLHGPFYVEIIGSAEAEPLLGQMRIFSQNFMQSSPASAEKLEELELFPVENLNPDSLALIAVDGFGYDRFNQIFTAVYTKENIQVTAFLSRRSSPAEAQELVQGYRDFLIAYGGKIVKTDLPIEDVQIVDILENYELIFARGHYLAGVHEAVDREQAEALALLLDRKLSERADDRK